MIWDLSARVAKPCIWMLTTFHDFACPEREKRCMFMDIIMTLHVPTWSFVISFGSSSLECPI